MRQQNKCVCKAVCGSALAFVLMSGLSASATTFSTNTVDGLVYLLTTYNGGAHVIELAPGDYFLRDADKMSETHGPTHLYANKLRIRGTGSSREETRLVGSGNLRILYGEASATVENLTLTNGNAKTVAGIGTSDRGGAAYGSVAITNCLIAGNVGAGYGGAVSGGASARVCRFVGNRAKHGGAAHLGSYYDTTFEGNVATGEGGAIYNATLLQDCLVVSNVAALAGGGVNNSPYLLRTVVAYNESTGKDGGGVNAVKTIVDCTIRNNKAAGNGGGVSGTLTAVTNSLIACNVAAERGGVSFSDASSVCYGCVISNNAAMTKYGAGYAGTYQKCHIIGNEAPAYGGINHAKVYDSRIEFNLTRSGDQGGGAYDSTVSNCVVYANYGANVNANCFACGVSSCTVYDSEISGNFSTATGQTPKGGAVYGCAGGAYLSTLYNCFVHDNYTLTFGGGVRDSTCYGCVISNNVSTGNGPNALNCRLSDCRIEGSGVYGCRLERSVFRNIGQPFDIVNPNISKTHTENYMTNGDVCMTNCLIVGNVFVNKSGVLFRGVSDVTAKCSLVNCTVVSNACRYTFDYYKESDNPINVINCVFADNRELYGTTDRPNDIVMADPNGGVVFSKCAYGTSTVDSSILEGCVAAGSSLYTFGDGYGVKIGSSPLFVRSGEHPYDLRVSSPLRGLGDVADWMMSATDIRGEPRLRDGSVDLGCYQRWAKPEGFFIYVR